MTYKLTIEQKPGYLHVVVTGQNGRENVLSYFREMLEQCAAHGCFRVLVEERLDGPRLGWLEVYRLTADTSTEAATVLQAMAYVDVYAEGRTMQFAETVALNRGLLVTVFPTVADAEKWLRENREPGADKPDVPYPGNPGPP